MNWAREGWQLTAVGAENSTLHIVHGAARAALPALAPQTKGVIHARRPGSLRPEQVDSLGLRQPKLSHVRTPTDEGALTGQIDLGPFLTHTPPAADTGNQAPPSRGRHGQAAVHHAELPLLMPTATSSQPAMNTNKERHTGHKLLLCLLTSLGGCARSETNCCLHTQNILPCTRAGKRWCQLLPPLLMPPDTLGSSKAGCRHCCPHASHLQHSIQLCHLE